MRWVWTDEMARRMTASDPGTSRVLRRLIDAPVAVRVDTGTDEYDVARLLGLGDVVPAADTREDTPRVAATCACGCCQVPPTGS